MTESEQSIVDTIYRAQLSCCTSYDVLIPNCYTAPDNEADVLALRKSGLCDEFEIKISRQDFLNDRKKVVNYRECEYKPREPTLDTVWLQTYQDLPPAEYKKLIAPWQMLKHDALITGHTPVNYFWYVLKEGIATEDEVPEPFGVVFVSGEDFRVIRPSTRLHANKLSFEDRYHMARKLGFRFWDYRMGRR